MDFMMGGDRKVTPEEKQGRKLAKKELMRPFFKARDEGIYTIVDFDASKAPHVRDDSKIPLFELYSWLKNSNSWFPLVKSFIRRTSKAHPKFFWIHLIGTLIKETLPVLQVQIIAYIIGLTTIAVDRGELHLHALVGAVACKVLLEFFAHWVKMTLKETDGALKFEYQTMIREQLMAERSRLDMLTYNEDKVQGYFASAEELLKYFECLTAPISIVSCFIGAVIQIMFLRRITNEGNWDMIVWSTGAIAIEWAGWLFVAFGNNRRHLITDADHHRMEDVFKTTSKSTIHQDVMLLGLSGYFYREFQAAVSRIRTKSTLEPVDKMNRADLAKTTGALSQGMLYILFACRAAKDPGTALFSMGQLDLLKQAGEALAGNLYGVLCQLFELKIQMKSLKDFERIRHIPSRMEPPRNPVVYEPLPMQPDGRKGMEIEFKNVSFQYPNSRKMALNNISFKAAPGELICICGYNGAGKSTLVNLLTRLYDPTFGTVLVNGIPAKQYDPADIRRQCTVLLQKPNPLDVTLKEWVGLGNVSDINNVPKIEAAIDAAGASKIVSRLAKKLETPLGPEPLHHNPKSFLNSCVDMEVESDDGDDNDKDTWDDWWAEEEKGWGWENERGADELGAVPGFSGGEWKKFAIARSLMRENAQLKIVDEFSSALDPLAEANAFNQIYSSKGQQTIIFITHRMHTAPKADRIIMMADGEIKEQGSHAELMAQNGRYAELFRAQADGFMEEAARAQLTTKAEQAAKFEAAKRDIPNDVDVANEIDVEDEIDSESDTGEGTSSGEESW